MQKLMSWFWGSVWILIALIELYIGVNTPGTKGVVSLAIGAGLLLWQGIRLQRLLQARKSTGG